MRHIGGVIPILVTPFTEDEAVDRHALEAQIDLLSGAGIQWVGLGYGSEVPRLMPEEISDIVRAVKDVAPHIGVIANAEVAGRQAGIRTLEEAARSGADAVMVRPAHMAGAPAAALVDTLAEVFETVGVDIVLQDAPQHTGVVLDAEMLAAALLEVPRVVAVKIEPPVGAISKMRAVAQLLEGRPGVILGGSGGKDYLLELRAGSTGTMPGPAYVELYQGIESLVNADRAADAWRLLGRFLPLLGLGAVASNMDGFLASQKYILNKRGAHMSTRLRGPSNDIPAQVFELIDEVWDALGLDGELEALRAAHSGVRA